MFKYETLAFIKNVSFRFNNRDKDLYKSLLKERVLNLNFLSVLPVLILFLVSPYDAHGQDAPRIEEMLPQTCIEIPAEKKVAECSCDLTPPAEFREPDRVSSDGSVERVSYPRLTAIGVGPHQDSAERDARETCSAAVREVLIKNGMSLREVDQYPLFSHILGCRPYVCRP